MSSPNNTAKSQKLMLLDLSKSVKPNKAVAAGSGGPTTAKPSETTIQINPINNHSFFSIRAGSGVANQPRLSFNPGAPPPHHHHRLTTTAPAPRPMVLNGLRHDPILLRPGPAHAYQLAHVHKLSPSSASSVSSCSSSVVSSCSTNCTSSSSCPNCTSSCAASSTSKASSVCSKAGSSSSMTTRSSTTSSSTSSSGTKRTGGTASSASSSSTLNDSNHSSDDSLISVDSTLSLSISNRTSSIGFSGSSSFSLSSTSGSTLSLSSSTSSSSSDDDDSSGRITRSSLGKSITNKRKSELEESRCRPQTQTQNLSPGRLAAVHESQGGPPSHKRHRPDRHNDSHNSIEVICLDDDDDEEPAPPAAVKSPAKPEPEPVMRCMWNDCEFVVKHVSGRPGAAASPTAQLVEHVKASHVSTQKKTNKCRCLWRGCSTYGQASKTLKLLERHVIEHAEKSPFRCFSAGCKAKFKSDEQRERHARSHLEMADSASSTHSSSSPVKTRKQQQPKQQQQQDEPAPAPAPDRKNLRKQQAEAAAAAKNSAQADKKSKAKKRRQNGNADALPRKFIRTQFKDYVDACTMKVIEKRLVDLEYQSGTVIFTPKICGMESRDGATWYLVEWQPPNVLKKEWLTRDEISESKTVSLAELSAQAVKDATSPFYRSLRFRPNRRK